MSNKEIISHHLLNGEFIYDVVDLTREPYPVTSLRSKEIADRLIIVNYWRKVNKFTFGAKKQKEEDKSDQDVIEIGSRKTIERPAIPPPQPPQKIFVTIPPKPKPQNVQIVHRTMVRPPPEIKRPAISDVFSPTKVFATNPIENREIGESVFAKVFTRSIANDSSQDDFFNALKNTENDEKIPCHINRIHSFDESVILTIECEAPMNEEGASHEETIFIEEELVKKMPNNFLHALATHGDEPFNSC